MIQLVRSRVRVPSAWALALCALFACSKPAKHVAEAGVTPSASPVGDEPDASTRPTATSSPPTASSSATAQQAPSAGPDAPASPQLELRTGASPYDWRLDARGLPAVSTDGRRVAVLLRDHDGMRGFPNGALVILDVDRDKVVSKTPLLSSDELAKALTPPQLAALEAKVRARLARAEVLVAAVTWTKSAAAEHVWDADAGAFSLPDVAGVAARLVGERLRLTDATTSRVLLDQDARPWQLPESPLGPGLTPCAFSPEVAALAVDRARRVAFVLVAQTVTRGGDTCDAPVAPHAFRLAP